MNVRVGAEPPLCVPYSCLGLKERDTCFTFRAPVLPKQYIFGVIHTLDNIRDHTGLQWHCCCVKFRSWTKWDSFQGKLLYDSIKAQNGGWSGKIIFFPNSGIFSRYILVLIFTLFLFKVILILLLKNISRFLKSNIIHQEELLRYNRIVNEVKIFVLKLSVSLHWRILLFFLLQLQVQSCYSFFNCWISTADLLSLVSVWVLKL